MKKMILVAAALTLVGCNKEEAKDTATQAAEKAREIAVEAKDAVKAGAEKAEPYVKEGADKVKEGVHDAAGWVEEKTRTTSTAPATEP